MRWRRITFTLIAVCGMLIVPDTAFAAPAHAVGGGGLLGTVGGLVGGVFSAVGHAVLGAFTWTISLATKFILTTIAALVKLLIPASWAHKGLEVMEWIVSVPDYAGRITSPSGATQYGFAGINALRDLFTWLGVAVAPLTLVYATSRAMLGEREPVAIPVLRVLAVAAAIVVYPYLWSQGAALADQITHAILNLPAVSRGLYKLMDYAVGGVALGGWQLIDLGLMGAIALALLALIFLKVVVILLGALLYATGPLMIGLVATESGGALARAWVSAVVMLLGLGIVWAALFAVGALLIGDASTAGPLIAGNSTFGTLVGGLLLAVAGLASLWLCLKVAREAASLLRMQLAGLLVVSRRASTTTSATSGAASRARTTGQSLRDYGSRLTRGVGAAGGELAGAVPGGAALSAGARAVGQVGRRGILGTAAAGARSGAAELAARTEPLLGRTRAGVVAARMARAGTAAWQAEPVTPRNPAQPSNSPGKAAAARTGSDRPATDTANGRRSDRQVRAALPARGANTQTRTPVGTPANASRPTPASPTESSPGRAGNPSTDPARAGRPPSVPPRASTRAPEPSTPRRSGAGGSPPPPRSSTAPRTSSRPPQPTPQKTAQAPAKRPTPPPTPPPKPPARASRDDGRRSDR